MQYLTRHPAAKTIVVILTAILAATLLIIDAENVMAQNRTDQRCFESRRIMQTSPADGLEIIEGASRSILLTSEEAIMFRLINQERAKAGLTELEIDPILMRIARDKSRDMVSHNYFGHLSERLGTVHDQLKANGLNYNCVAENLAGGPDLNRIQQRLLSSPAHCSNILNPSFARIGIGIVKGAPYGNMVTQIFID